MKVKAVEAPTAREALGGMARGVDQGGHIMALMQLPAGTDFAAFLKGLPHDHCQCPHWGYVLEGRIEVTYQDGQSETVEAGDLYYWPPGHTVAFPVDTKYVEFSPSAGMNDALDHVVDRLSNS